MYQISSTTSARQQNWLMRKTVFLRKERIERKKKLTDWKQALFFFFRSIANINFLSKLRFPLHTSVIKGEMVARRTEGKDRGFITYETENGSFEIESDLPREFLAFASVDFLVSSALILPPKFLSILAVICKQF